jgi:hypothetical protein
MPRKKSKGARGEGRRRSESDSVSNSQYSWIKALGMRVLFFVLFAAISGIGMSVYWNYFHTDKPLHTFSAKERGAFIQALKSGGVPVLSVWLACPDGKQDVCRLVNQFITMFQESGWRVERNQVVQWKPAHPLEGVYLILQANGEPDDLTRASEKSIRSSFTALGIPVHSASAPDVPKNSIGIYFGPDL